MLSRGWDCQVFLELDPGNWKVLTPSLVLEMYFLPTIPIVGTIFKDTTLRELAVVGNIWTVYMTEASKPLYKLLRFGGWVLKPLVLWLPNETL